MTVLITLTTVGADCSTFDIYSDVDGFLSAFETDIPKGSLLTGFSSSNVPDGTFTIRIKAKGLCSNYIDLNLDETPVTTTTTSSTSSTTTTLFSTNYCFEGRYAPDDSLHPDGGNVAFINKYGELEVINFIYYPDTISIEASSIVSTFAVRPCT